MHQASRAKVANEQSSEQMKWMSKFQDVLNHSARLRNFITINKECFEHILAKRHLSTALSKHPPLKKIFRNMMWADKLRKKKICNNMKRNHF